MKLVIRGLWLIFNYGDDMIPSIQNIDSKISDINYNKKIYLRFCHLDLLARGEYKFRKF